jgi:arginine utilization protein RocB
MAAEMVNRMELSTDFIDQIDNEMSPPPTCLDLRILKDAYNVQTPSLAYAMFNILTLKQSVQEVLDKLQHIANQSAEAIFARLVERYRQPNGEVRAEQKLSRMRPKVFLYSELYKRGMELFGESFINDINDSIRQLEVASSDPRDATVRLTQRISSYFMGEKPFYVILLAPTLLSTCILR